MGEIAIDSRESLINNIENNIYTERDSRIKSLKSSKYLNIRIFKRLSENMHYEVLKYISAKELIQIRGCTLGGFQLTSNSLLRSRITNYFPYLSPELILDCKKSKEKICAEENIRGLELIFQHTGKGAINYLGREIGGRRLSQLAKTFSSLGTQITAINLCRLG